MRVSSQNRSAYTLLELMIVVTIIGILAAIAAPGVGRGMRERRKVRATHDVVRTFQAARQAAIASGAAVLVRYDPSALNGRGSLEVYRGTTNRCNTTPWQTSVAGSESVVGSGCAGNLRCMRQASFDPTAFEVTGTPYTIELALTNTGLGQGIEVCYEGTGVMSWRLGHPDYFYDTPALATGESVAGGFTFTVSALVDSADPGVVRRVVVPFGAEARYVR